jgi:hypothetical protein
MGKKSLKFAMTLQVVIKVVKQTDLLILNIAELLLLHMVKLHLTHEALTVVPRLAGVGARVVQDDVHHRDLESLGDVHVVWGLGPPVRTVDNWKILVDRRFSLCHLNFRWVIQELVPDRGFSGRHCDY